MDATVNTQIEELRPPLENKRKGDFMADLTQQHLHQERDFLRDITVSLNAALFIVDRLTEEIKEEEGRLENDPEADKMFHHLVDALGRVDSMIKSRRHQLNSLLDNEKESLSRPSF